MLVIYTLRCTWLAWVRRHRGGGGNSLNPAPFFLKSLLIDSRYGENNVLCPNIPPCIFCLLLENRKSTRAWPILKSNSTSLWFNFFFPRMNNKNFMKRGLGAPLLFLYKVSIIVLIDFIAILLTPGIFLIQIINTNVFNSF